MSSKRYPDEFKIEAVKQVVELGYPVAEVAKRLGITTHSLYAWKKKFGPDSVEHNEKVSAEKEIRRLQKELKRVTDERDIQKKPRCTSPTSPTEVHLYPLPQPPQDFLSDHNLQASTSRRGNCHDNAVAENFFQLLKRERIKRHIYATRSDTRTDIVDYIEMFYNNKRRHGFDDLLSPVEYGEKFKERLVSV